jgi:hypothetical protein
MPFHPRIPHPRGLRSPGKLTPPSGIMSNTSQVAKVL